MQTLCSLCSLNFHYFGQNDLDFLFVWTHWSCTVHGTSLLHCHWGVNGLYEGKIKISLVISILKQLIFFNKICHLIGNKNIYHKVSLIQIVCVHLFVFMEIVIHLVTFRNGNNKVTFFRTLNKDSSLCIEKRNTWKATVFSGNINSVSLSSAGCSYLGSIGNLRFGKDITQIIAQAHLRVDLLFASKEDKSIQEHVLFRALLYMQLFCYDWDIDSEFQKFLLSLFFFQYFPHLFVSCGINWMCEALRADC